MKKTLRSLFLWTVTAAMIAPASFAASVLPVNPVAVPRVETPVTENPKDAIKSALADFKSLSRKERKERIREVKHELKEYNKMKRSGHAPSTDQTLLIILAILLPPLAVYLHEGTINTKFWISLILTLLFFLPGIIYALVVVLNKD